MGWFNNKSAKENKPKYPPFDRGQIVRHKLLNCNYMWLGEPQRAGVGYSTWRTGEYSVRLPDGQSRFCYPEEVEAVTVEAAVLEAVK